MLYKKFYDESDGCKNARHFYRSSPTASHEVPCQKMRIEEMVFPVEGRQLRTKGMNCIYNGYCRGPHGPPIFYRLYGPSGLTPQGSTLLLSNTNHPNHCTDVSQQDQGFRKMQQDATQQYLKMKFFVLHSVGNVIFSLHAMIISCPLRMLHFDFVVTPIASPDMCVRRRKILGT